MGSLNFELQNILDGNHKIIEEIFMNKVHVTSGVDFFGFHLCAIFLAQVNDVIGVDNFYTGLKSKLVYKGASGR